MKDKTKYSSVLKTCWKMFSVSKTNSPNKTPEQIYAAIHDTYTQWYKQDEYNINSIASLRAWELWYSDYKKEFLHIFFLENKLKESLENIKIKVDKIKEFIREKGDTEMMWSDTYKGNIAVKIFCFGIHLPQTKHGFAFKFMLYDNQLITYCFKDDTGGFEITEESYKLLQKQKEGQGKVQTFQLCINTILYMDCYPECIIEGVPDEWCDLKSKGRKIKLSVSDDFKEIISTGGAKSHYMKGAYFMTFKNERYTKMRWQTKFIKPQFINGKAITVKNSNEFSKLENI